MLACHGASGGLRIARECLLVAPLEFAHEPRVEGEQPVHDRVEFPAQRRVRDLGGRGELPVPVALAPLIVHDVARALLEVGREPRTLDDLGQDVGDILAGQVRAAELRHGIVAVLGEHLFVEFFGARLAHRLAWGDLRLGQRGDALRGVLVKLVEKQAAAAISASGCSGQRAHP